MKRFGVFILFSAITFALPLNAQVMWNLKGGIMERSVYHFPDYSYYTFSHDDADFEKRIDWMAGLELEIPLSRKLNLETGLRYKNHYSLVSLDDDYVDNWRYAHWAEATSHIELPLRLTYKQTLGKHFSLHVGVGPYASYALGDEFGEKWDNNLQVGLEPSIAINWACLSLGATYNVPCFYKGFKDENKPAVMATLGIRFKSHVWRYVGATLLAIASVGAAAAAVWPTNDGYGSYSSGSYGPSYSSSSSSDGNYEKMYKKWEKQAQNAYNSLAGHSGGTVTYQKNKQLLRDAQEEMRKWREKARRAGITIPQSEWETKTVSVY